VTYDVSTQSGQAAGTVAVAMSGGVDSTLAACLLVEAGRHVFGATMLLGTRDSSTAAEDLASARSACDHLGIEHVIIHLCAEFEAAVVTPFSDAYASGLTPNPCIACNERIKFGLFVERLLAMGAQRVATGHYARLERQGDTTWLLRGLDTDKDQSYFLYRIPPAVLEVLEFPIGALSKAAVRAAAVSRRLASARRTESQEMCFVRDHIDLIGARRPDALEPGPIVDAQGRLLGTHHGIARYTVGQRKGLGLSGPEGPFRVVLIDPIANALVVEPTTRGPSCTNVRLRDAVWRLEGSARVDARIRYRGASVAATATPALPQLHVTFAAPVLPLAPGQSVVLYQGDRVVGGGYVPPEGAM